MKKKELIKRYIYFITIISSFVYLIFRTFFTIPIGSSLDTLFGVIVLIIEIIDFIFFIVYAVNILMKDDNVPDKP